ncbi:amino acid permease-domain-containing protein [Phycomyces nitens]|nr:amino acid permease-domain-containing protein [Phycomyces nitens]
MDSDINQITEIEPQGRKFQTDEEILASFGYKQMWGDAMQSGGSVAVVWGWIIVSIFTFGVGLSLAEICSAYPVTGGLYIWVSRLAPPEWVPIACWLTGWCNWLVAITSSDLGLAQFLASVIAINNPEYNASIYWQYGIFLVIAFVHGVINSASIKYNGFFNQTSLYWHLAGTLMIIIVALVMTPNKPDAKWVFTYFENDTGFSSGGYAFLVGLLQSQYTLSGFDSAAHMSDETQDAARNAPRGILYAIGTASIVGFAFMLSVNFCVQDFQAQVVSELALQPQMTQIFLDGVGYKWTIVFTVIVMGAMFFSGSALTLGSSRMVYAFARDGAMPFSKWLSHVNERTQTPIYAVWGNIIFAVIVGLLFIVNETAFNAIVSINTIASSLAYFIPIVLRLTVARKTFVRGPFHLGPFSDIINFSSCCWILLTSALFICPTEYPVTADNMNYASVPLVAVLGGSIAYYHFRARKWFHGPGKLNDTDSSTGSSGDFNIDHPHVSTDIKNEKFTEKPTEKILLSKISSRQDSNITPN